MKVWESDANDDEPENARVERLDGRAAVRERCHQDCRRRLFNYQIASNASGRPTAKVEARHPRGDFKLVSLTLTTHQKRERERTIANKKESKQLIIGNHRWQRQWHFNDGAHRLKGARGSINSSGRARISRTASIA